jgi:hypothetical protein
VDGEVLDVNGFDLQKFLSHGFINYQHLAGKDPSSIIGEPTKAEVKNGKLHIEAILYPDSEMARKVYDLAKALENSPSGRRLGYSIEGKALARDPRNKKYISKSLITGCAVTPMPKCSGTELTIIKGGLSQLDSFDTIEKSEAVSEFVIDTVDADGVRWTVDQHLNIQKAVPEEESVKKSEGVQVGATAAASEGVTQKESVEGAKKSKKKKNSENIFENKEFFSKAEIYKELFSRFNLGVDLAKSFVALVDKVHYLRTSNMAAEKYSAEELKKAMEILDLVKSESTPAPETKEEEKKVETTETKEEPISKAVDADKLKAEYDECMKKAEELKKQAAAVNIDLSNPQGNPQGGEVTTIKKSEEIEAPAVNVDEIRKGIMSEMNMKFTALGTLIQSKEAENNELRKSIQGLEEFNTRLAERLGMIEKQPNERKSLAGVTYKERFEKSEQPNTPAEKVFSLSNMTDRAKLADLMTPKAMIQKGEDTEILDRAYAESIA